MKIVYLLVLASLTLVACETPGYGDHKDNSQVYKVAEGTEVATFNGYVVEVTEENTIRIKVPKRGELIKKGWEVNEQGIVTVALASIQLPSDNVPFANEANAALKEMLLNKEITVDVLGGNTSVTSFAAEKTFNQLTGYIHVNNPEAEFLIQKVLLENGLAIIDKNTPYLEKYIKEFESLQTVAQNNTMGVWAVDGFVRLTNNFEGHFVELVDINDDQVNQVIKQLKDKGWSIDNILQEHLK